MRSALLLLALLALSGAATACSLAGPVPGPGSFVLRDLETGQTWRVPVEHRALGATCELSNRFALDGHRFAWVETERVDDRTRSAIHLQDLSTGETIVVARHEGPHIDQIALAGPILTALTVDYTHGRATHEIVRFDLDRITRATLALPGGGRPQTTLAGPLVVHLADAPEGRVLSAHDAREDRWILHRAPLSQLGLPAEAWVRAADDSWLLLDGRDGDAHVLDVRALRAHNVSAQTARRWVVDLDDGWLYARDAQNLSRMRLPEGAWEASRADFSGPLVAVDDGRLVEGHYGGEGSLPPRDAPPLFPVETETTPPTRAVALGPLGTLAAAAAGALLRGPKHVTTMRGFAKP